MTDCFEDLETIHSGIGILALFWWSGDPEIWMEYLSEDFPLSQETFKCTILEFTEQHIDVDLEVTLRVDYILPEGNFPSTVR